MASWANVLTYIFGQTMQVETSEYDLKRWEKFTIEIWWYEELQNFEQSVKIVTFAVLSNIIYDIDIHA